MSKFTMTLLVIWVLSACVNKTQPAVTDIQQTDATSIPPTQQPNQIPSLTSQSASSTNPLCANEYLPIVLNARWVYKLSIIQENGADLVAYEDYEIVKIENNEISFIFAISDRNEFSNAGALVGSAEIQKWLCSPEGIRAGDGDGIMLPSKIQIGTTWKDTYNGTERVYKYIGSETVTVPAGTFTALRMDLSVGTPELTLSYWYAPGVGKVKSVINQGSFKKLTELVSFEQPTSPAQSDLNDIAMVLVPQGEFTMGSEDGRNNEKPVHQVYLDAYYIDSYEVTNAQYKKCVDTRTCNEPTDIERYSDLQYAQHPVVYISWDMAKAYCEWRGARLPTEAEWEKAARGTDGRTFPWGENIDNTFANILSSVGDTTPVEAFPKDISPYGVYDMTGNVYEIVADWYDKSYYSVSPNSNPLGPETGDSPVVRGGAWNTGISSVRSTARGSGDPVNNNGPFVGFRCAKSSQ